MTGIKSSNLGGSVKSLLLLDDLGLRLGAHNTTTPLLARVVVAGHVAILDRGHELGELGLVLGSHLGDSENGSGLLWSAGAK